MSDDTTKETVVEIETVVETPDGAVVDVVDVEIVNEKKYLIQDIILTSADSLLEAVSDIKADGYRLGQICATKVDDAIEIIYSFDKNVVLKNLKVIVGDVAPVLQSISSIYWPAFIYENEMHDLFGITFKNLALDFGGKFFKIAKETPWNPPKAVTEGQEQGLDPGTVAQDDTVVAQDDAVIAQDDTVVVQEDTEGSEA